ncbi:MAG: hypothetical protein MUE34_11735 [Acidimicrobiales bacterium]|nr:hypothetical protein [Acidimicrobiales bacterium]
MGEHEPTSRERRRMLEVSSPEGDLTGASEWYEWGPYLAERAWGTVREDYSADGNAWESFPHEHARSRAYRWNEDGLAGISDLRQRLCLALALWNGRDPILKERIFGLTGPEGNHGEDAKEYWWYLDALPSHAWLRWRYHYPQAAFPYDLLVAENARRGFHDPEFELLDTGVFDGDRYWSVEVTYAKASPTDVLMEIEVENHGPEPDVLHVLPTLWFRNTWSWSGDDRRPPVITHQGETLRAALDDGTYELIAGTGPAGEPLPLLCDNETNTARLFGSPCTTPYPKDGINDHVLHGTPTVNPAGTGTKAAWWYRFTVPGGGRTVLRLRLRRRDPDDVVPEPAARRELLGSDFDAVSAARREEADEFYSSLLPRGTDPDVAKVLRQASAGLVWSKQYYPFRVARWLDGDPGQPPPPAERLRGRNAGWRHLDAEDILAMPDPWEYPWFAAWDLAFHAVAWAHLDPAFAKYQVLVLLREWYLNPNGALPAYEWSFDDVNPPVHAYAALRVFLVDGGEDVAFLERAFQKLLLNYMWWLNRHDPDGNNLVGGGFLGLDNISPIDRSHLPPGAVLEQADGTAWLAFNTIAMLAIAVILSEDNEVYDDLAVTFLERFMMISRAVNRSGLYDAERGFFYDQVLTGDRSERVAVETIGGAVPLFSSVLVTTPAVGDRRRIALRERILRILDRENLDITDLEAAGHLRRRDDLTELLVSIVTPEQLRTTLTELFDESSFLSPYGLRSLSKRYDGRPYTITVDGVSYPIDYAPAESSTPMYGGNSNWRGPVWIPMNHMVIRSLVRFHHFVGDDFTIEYPTGSGEQRTLRAIAQDLADRVVATFLRDADGHRPVFGGTQRFQQDPAWDNLLFFEYFHGDNGAGLGASHQTGWTALVIDLILDPPASSELGWHRRSER